jgi:Sec-independent protein translocase protein TatA
MTLAIIFESVGVGEWFLLLAVVLIVVGPKRMPEMARKFGQYYSKFRRAADSFKRQLMDMDTEFNRAVDEAAKEVADGTGIPDDAGSSSPDYYAPGNEYGYERGYDESGYDESGYDESGEYHGESAEVAPSAVAADPSPDAPQSASASGVKITVSPLPGPEAKENGNKTA